MRRFVQGGSTTITDRRSVLWAGAFAAGALVSPRAFPAAGDHDVSDWASSEHARVRLIDAGPSRAGRLAGLQIQLDPSFLTYWRTPGEAGVPPTAVFDGSTNLRSAQLQFPAPQRFDEAGSEAFGYKDEVVFPIAVQPADPQQPVTLAIALSFAVCADLCLPGQVELGLTLDRSGQAPEAALVRDAVQRVPVPTPLDGPGPLAVMGVDRDEAPDRARVRVRVPAGSIPALFVETPEPWYLQVAKREGVGADASFDLRVLAGPKQPGRVPLTFTLCAGDVAVETKAELDLAAPLP